MKNNNTKESTTQQEKSKNQVSKSDEAECRNATAHFLKRFKIVTILGECGAYKAKGVPISVIMHLQPDVQSHEHVLSDQTGCLP